MKEYQMDGHIYQVECVHTGQYHPYGDTFRVFEVYTDDTDSANVLHVMKSMFGYDVPLKKDWNTHDIFDYFRGYCEVEPIDGGFKYTRCAIVLDVIIFNI